MQKPAKAPKTSEEQLQSGALGLLRTQIRMVKAAQFSHGGSLDELKQLTDAVGNINRAAAAILAETRKQEDAARKAVAAMSMDEKVELVLGFLEELPIDHRLRIGAKIVELGGGLL